MLVLAAKEGDPLAKKFSSLVGKMRPERRARAQERAQEILTEMALQELRPAREFSQAQLAETLGEKQPNISQLEQRTDMYVSTPRKYVEAVSSTSSPAFLRGQSAFDSSRSSVQRSRR